MADTKVLPSDSDPIDWAKDDDTTIIRKINARISDADSLHTKKMAEYKRASAYLDGHPERVDSTKEAMIFNPIFPIVRNMVGLTTDSRPHPSVKLSRIPKDMSREEIQGLMETGDKLEHSLDDWWEDERMQSALQRIVLGLYTYSDFFLVPYWDEERGDVCVYEASPKHIKLDPNADRASEGDCFILEIFRSKSKMYAQFGEEKCKDLVFSDHKELREFERDGVENDSNTKLMKNVCKLEIYIEREWWVYKSGDKILDKIPSPVYVPDALKQKERMKQSVEAKYKKGGIGGMITSAADTIKGALGMETTDDKMGVEIDQMMGAFEPKENYLRYPKLPIIHFETYRMSGELYSRSTMELSISIVDEISQRKQDISLNSASTGKPNTVVDGNLYNEADADKLQLGSANNEVVRLKTTGGKSLNDSIRVLQGTPLPAQFFDDLNNSMAQLDTLWGHHEVSKGAGDPSSRTKGGILALQEADQTPIRYVSRNIEDGLQELFEWVVQIRKLKMKDGISVGEDYIDYSEVTSMHRTFVKSGSMMPVSKEQQRTQALEEYRLSAIDPLTYHERVGDADPEKTAKRLESWLQSKTILSDDIGNQQERVVEKLKLIKAGRQDEVQVEQDDDPTVHHDMLLMALKSGQFSPEQEKIIGGLIEQYAQLVQQGQGQQPPAGQPTGQPPAATPEVA